MKPLAKTFQNMSNRPYSLASIIAFVIMIGIAITDSSGGTYYVSSTSGSDSYTPAQAQNSTTPWQSLTKISTQAFAPVTTFFSSAAIRGRGALRFLHRARVEIRSPMARMPPEQIR